MKNPLSDIYSQQVLLQEAKSNVVVKPGQQEIAKGGKVPVAKSGGDEKVKKHVPKAKESKEYSDGGKAKKVSLKEEASSDFEGAFEKLFKATLNEEFGNSMNPFEPEVPTTNDEMADELGETEDEVSDLVSDLKSVIDHLQSILDKVGSEEKGEEDSFEDESSEEAKDEVENEIREESKEESEDEDEEKVEEAVDAEEKGHALHNLKAGTDLQKPGSKEVKGAVPVSKGKANSGDIDSDDKLKPAKTFDKSLQNPKGKPEVSSTIKAGDFFKK